MRGRDLIAELRRRELPHGGWSFGNSRQPSVEATCLAILALASESADAGGRSVHLLLSLQRPDGSWPAFAGDEEASWTTALGVITLSPLEGNSGAREKASAWLLDARGREAHWLWRWKFKMADTQARIDPDKYGWPWSLGANSWVIPTAFAIVALKQLGACNQLEHLNPRIRIGAAMLLDRACVGGGWNAGNSVVYGVPLMPHIEATAIALMALQGEPQHHLILEGRNWLKWQATAVSAVSSLAWSILSLFLFGIPVEDLKSRLADRLQDPSRIRNNATLAVAALALRCGETIHPFALIQ